MHSGNSEARKRAKQQQAYSSEPSNPGMRKIGLRYPMPLSPKGTSAGDNQTTSNCGHHPGEMATGRWLQHRRYSAGKERSQTSASRRLRTKSNQRLERQASGILWPLNPKGTNAGGSQGTCKCGYPPGAKVTEPHSRKPKAQNQMKPGMRKTGHRNTTSLNPKNISAE